MTRTEGRAAAPGTITDEAVEVLRRRIGIPEPHPVPPRYLEPGVDAFRNVADALRAIQSDAVTLRAQERAVRTASDSFTLAREQFRAGAITYLTLLNAERAYEQALIGLVQAQAARYADTAALFQALGGGWWSRADIPSDASRPPTPREASVGPTGETQVSARP